jgi:fido (protein-threonine AMPylation protein)
MDTPLSVKFDIARLKAIHRYIFQGVFERHGARPSAMFWRQLKASHL